MTNDEAIKLLMSMKDGIIHVFDGDRMIALEMAISALQAQDVPDTNDGDLISRQAAIEAAIKATDDWDGGYNITRANMIEKELNDLPSAKPEPCEDAVSRQAVIDAARKVHDIFEGEYDTRTPYGVIFDVQDAVCKLPSVQPEIIRCKDCKFYTPMNRETKTGICSLTLHQNFGDNWFCAGAERRTDEQSD